MNVVLDFIVGKNTGFMYWGIVIIYVVFIHMYIVIREMTIKLLIGHKKIF